MNFETILDAMAEAKYERWASQGEFDHERRVRQYHTFRARILRVDAEKKNLIDELFLRIGDRERIIRERTDTLAAKDDRIAELEETIREMRGFL